MSTKAYNLFQVENTGGLSSGNCFSLVWSMIFILPEQEKEIF